MYILQKLLVQKKRSNIYLYKTKFYLKKLLLFVLLMNYQMKKKLNSRIKYNKNQLLKYLRKKNKLKLENMKNQHYAIILSSRFLFKI